jgi:elongation factor Tu
MPTDPAFRMTVDDVFSIRGRGTVATGRIAQGTLNVGDTVLIVRPGFAQAAVVTGIEMFSQTTSTGQAGDNVGVLLRDVGKDEIQRGDVLVASSGAV